MGAFEKLHEKIQEALWSLQWDELRPLQVEAIYAVLDTDNDIILSAATASGKTEAAFLPILSQLAAEPAQSVQLLYVGPLKALINDQFRRLENLCAYAGIPVHRWHGDVSATAKRRLRESPSGVLLITPESIESLFINYDRYVAAIFAHLDFVVIDELHAFLEDVRGIHLRSLLARLGIAAGVTPRLLGLSATIGDFAPAQAFLCPEAPDTVCVIEDKTQAKELQVSLKADLDAEPVEGALVPVGLDAVAADIAERCRSDSNLVFCNSRRQTELLADKLREHCEREQWPRNPFMLHHGSLSRELREDAEQALKSGQPVTAICTTTLELGIDLGAVRAIGQVGPPGSVSSLAQRLGRSGRRQGEPQILRLYTLDRPLNGRSSLTDSLHPELIQGIAMVELHREGWLEAPTGNRFHFSTAVHQVLSVLRQTGGATAVHLFDVLCRRGAFRQIKAEQFATLLRGLSSKELIEQLPTGELILAPGGERIVESRDFYAAFASPIEFRVEHGGHRIGLLPPKGVPKPGEFLLLGGRRWRVELIEREAKLVVVTPAKGWKKPEFGGDVLGMHPGIAQRMKRVLSGDTSYPYLNPRASQLLRDARAAFARAGLETQDAIAGPGGVQWFPWRGSRVLRTLELCAQADGLKTDRDNLCLRYLKVSASDFAAHRARIAAGAFLPEQLVTLVVDLESDRFDEYVPEALLRQAFIAEVLDLEGARKVAVQN